MRTILISVLLLTLIGYAPQARAGDKIGAVLYKSPECSCCEQYADYLRDNGFEVTVRPTEDLSLIKEMNGVPDGFEGCHTTLVDGYVIEGHVPVDSVNRLLAERPDVTGISLPGMPEGAPGMTGSKSEPFVIYDFAPNREPSVFAVE